MLGPPLPIVARPPSEVVRFSTAGFLPHKLRRGYGFVWTPAHRVVLAGSVTALRRAVLPLLPGRLRELPASVAS